MVLLSHISPFGYISRLNVYDRSDFIEREKMRRIFRRSFAKTLDVEKTETDNVVHELFDYSSAVHADTSQRTDFRHKPLDHSQRVLRLIRIHGHLSKDGLVQCSIFHAVRKKRSYMCLSYVWDYSPPGMNEQDRASTTGNGAILLNGQYLEVRANLHEFLRMAQREGTTTSPNKAWRTKFDLSTPIWIDAICIDQTNKLERNHQVAQMGEIYRWADSVQVWLGRIPQSVLHELQPLHDVPASPGFDTMTLDSRLGHVLDSIEKPWGLEKFQLPISQACFDQIVHDYVLDNVYWARSWIVQEVSIARKLTYWLHTSEIYDHLHLRSIVTQFGKSPDLRSWMEPLPRYFNYEFSDYPRDYKHNLIVLVDRFSSTSCANPLDRIFSLLSLCALDTAQLEVDYEMPAEHLAYNVLSNHTGKLCICSVFVVIQALQRCKHSWEESLKTLDRDMPWVEFDLPAKDLRTSFQSELAHLVPQHIRFDSMCQFSYTGSIEDTYLGDERLVSVVKIVHTEPNDAKETLFRVRVALKVFHLMTPGRIRLCEKVKAIPPVPLECSIRLGRGGVQLVT